MSLDNIPAITQNFVFPLFNDKKLSVIEQYVAKDADIRTTFLEGKGPQILQKSIEDTFIAFPVFELTIEDITQQANKLTFTWTASALHEGSILNIPPTGQKIEFHGIVFGEIHDNLITKYHSHSNIPQTLYSHIQPSSNMTFPNQSILLDHENYDKEMSRLLFKIAKTTNARLTRRELESLNLWVKGFSIKETARQLGGLSVKTIQVFRNNIKKKFNVLSYRELLKCLQENDILSIFVQA